MWFRVLLGSAAADARSAPGRGTAGHWRAPVAGPVAAAAALTGAGAFVSCPVFPQASVLIGVQGSGASQRCHLLSFASVQDGKSALLGKGGIFNIPPPVTLLPISGSQLKYIFLLTTDGVALNVYFGLKGCRDVIPG